MGVSEIVSYSISVALIVVAVWQTIKKSNLQKYVKADAMELYRDAGILLGNVQTCLNGLREGDTSLAMLEAGRAEGMAQALFQRSVKNIYHHFNYTRSNLDQWIKSRKIQEGHKDAFLQYAEE